MRIAFDKGKDTIFADTTAIRASSSELLEIDLRDMGALLRLSGEDAVKITIKPKGNLAPGAEVFVDSLSSVDLIPGADVYRQYVNYNTDAMVAALNAADPAALVLDVKYLPASGPHITSPSIEISASRPVSSDDDGAPTALPTPDDWLDARAVRFDESQSLTSPQKTQAKTNLDLQNVSNTSDANKPVSTAQQAALDLKANLASPALTGTPTAPTASAGTNTTQIASTAFVKTAIDNLIAGAPGALDTLKEISDQLANDESAVSALTSTVAGKAPSARAINTTGLASGGGDLSADRTISVPAASQAEAEAGTDNAKAMTPLRVAEAIAALAGSGGGITRGSGTLRGWNSYTPPGAATITFGMGTTPGGTWIFVITIDGGSPQTYTFADSDPADGSIYLGAANGAPSDAPTLASAISSTQGVAATDDGSGNVTVTSNTTGSSSSVSVAGNVSASDAGEDAVGPSGQVGGVDLIAAVSGKKIKLVQIFALATSVGWNGILSIQYANGAVIAQRSLVAPSDGMVSFLVDGAAFNASNFKDGVTNSALQAAFSASGGDTLNNFGSGGSLDVVALANVES